MDTSLGSYVTKLNNRVKKCKHYEQADSTIGQKYFFCRAPLMAPA
jgi:hypothetical protein